MSTGYASLVLVVPNRVLGQRRAGSHPEAQSFSTTPWRGRAIRDVRITKNRIATAQTGIRLIGGLGRTAREQRDLRASGRQSHLGDAQGCFVRANVGGASGNRASLGGC